MPVRLLLGAFLLVFVGVSGLLHDIAVSSRFGGAMVAVAIVAGVGALLAAIAPVYPALEPAAFVAALLLLPGPSIAGHALVAITTLRGPAGIRRSRTRARR